MSAIDLSSLSGLLEALAYDDMPFGVHYTDQEPEGGYTPKPGVMPTREREAAGQVDWGQVFGNFSCVIGNIRRARKKGGQAWFSAEHFGCPGGAYYLGYLGPMNETIKVYLSTGVPGKLKGEHYLQDPQTAGEYFDWIDAPPAPKKYCVFQPLDQYLKDPPEVVMFFARPEVLSGLHFLSSFVTGDPQAVQAPFGAGCAYIATFPLKDGAAGRMRATVGGWDPSCRPYYKTDELSFAMPWAMFQQMLEMWPEAFFETRTWGVCKKKITRSKKAWGEGD